MAKKTNKIAILKSVLGISILILICIFVVSYNTEYLIVTDEINDKVYKFSVPNETFSLGYTHSVMKSECVEMFQVKGNGFVLTETVYESYGVGLPFLQGNEDEGEYELIDGKFHLKMNREFEKLSMYISEIPDHFIEIDNKRIYFNDLIGEDVKVTISVLRGFGIIKKGE